MIDRIHSQSEVALAGARRDVADASNAHEYYERAARSLDVSVSVDALRQRIARFASLDVVDDDSLLTVMMVIERQRCLFPVGRPWEREPIGTTRKATRVPVETRVAPPIAPADRAPRWRKWFVFKQGEELEVRFQHVTGTAFGNLFERLIHSRFHMSNDRSRVELLSDDRRWIQQCGGGDDERRLERKTRVDAVIERDYVVVRSIERRLDAAGSTGEVRHVRSRNRYSFLAPHDTDDQLVRAFVNLEVSLTAVLVDDAIGPKYEVELEMKNVARGENVQRCIDTLLRWMRSPYDYAHDAPCVVPRTCRPRHVMPLAKRDRCMRLLTTARSFVTLKLDGTRYHLHSNAAGLTLVSLDGHAMRIGDAIQPTAEPHDWLDGYVYRPPAVDVVLDCEVFFDERQVRVYTFDVADVEAPFEDRLRSLRKFHESPLATYAHVRVEMKTYAPLVNVDQLADVCERALRTPACDGVVINCGDADVYKWKPSTLQTVDVLVVRDADDSLVAYSCASADATDGAHSRLKPARVRGLDGRPVRLLIDSYLLGLPRDVCVSNTIVECLVEVAAGGATTLRPIRIRFSKRKPNPITVVNENMRLATGSLDIRELRGWGLQMARYALHTFKAQVLSGIPRGARLLDVGSGRGADADKWHGLDVTVVEPDDAVVQQLRDRAPSARVFVEPIERFVERADASGYSHVTMFSSLAYVDEAVLAHFYKQKAYVFILYQNGDDLLAASRAEFRVERVDARRLRLSIAKRAGALVVEERFVDDSIVDRCEAVGYAVTSHRLIVPPLMGVVDRAWFNTYRFLRLIP